MNILKLVSGIWFLVWLYGSALITSPVWIFIYAYDLGCPRDGEDRTLSFLEKIWAIGGFK